MLKTLPIEKLYSKSNVRNEIDETINELVESIEKNGLLSPLTVRDDENGKFEILAGHRRYEALKRLHEPFVECNIIEDCETDLDRIRVQLAENIQRKDMSAFEYVEVFEQLKNKYGVTNKNLASFLNKPISWVTCQYTAVNLLNKEYGDKELIPEEDKKLSGAAIRYKFKVKRESAGNVKGLKGKGYSASIRGHNYCIWCSDIEFEQKLLEFLNNNKE